MEYNFENEINLFFTDNDYDEHQSNHQNEGSQFFGGQLQNGGTPLQSHERHQLNVGSKSGSETGDEGHQSTNNKQQKQ